jgi:flagellar basal body-associated protein FliL
MEKKILYIGLALIVIAIVILIVTTFTGAGLGQYLVTQNTTIASGHFFSLQLNSSSPSLFILIAATSNPVNMYLFNQSGFTAWNARASNVSGISSAISLEGAGTFLVYKNAMNATIPETSYTTSPLYSSNQSQLYSAGKYYFVIDNTNGSASAATQVLAHIAYLPPISNSSLQNGPLVGLNGQLQEDIILGIVFFVFLVAGIIVLLYGFFRKPKDKTDVPPKPGKAPAASSSEEVDALYKDVGKKKKKKADTQAIYS